MAYTIVDSGEAQHGLSVRFLDFLHSLLSSQYVARHCWNPEKRNDVKYGGWSVISALTQGQPGLHWEKKRKGMNFLTFMAGLAWKIFRFPCPPSGRKYWILWITLKNWQAEESGERLYFRDLPDFNWKYSACWSNMFLAVYFMDLNVTIV